jgi:hypothetical protein
VLLILLVFASGLIIGASAATIIIAQQFRYAMRHPNEIPTRLTARLTRRLNLDASQSDQVRALLTVRLAHLQQVRQQVQPQVRAELRGFHEDVRKLLNPTQQTKWDTMFDDLMENWMPPATDVPATTQPAGDSFERG